jgi:hypothetical protein
VVVVGKRERDHWRLELESGVYPQSLQEPKMGGSRLAQMADEEEELGTSGHGVEQAASNLSSRISRT